MQFKLSAALIDKQFYTKKQKEVFMKSFLKIIPLVCLFFMIPIILQAENPSQGYHDYDALTSALKKIASQYPDITKLESIGTTVEGKSIWMIRISGTNGPSPLEKQALLICGNLEADHVIGSEVALGIAQHLAQNYTQDDQVKKVLDQRTFYIIPRLNPDGAERFFKEVLYETSENLKPRDEDFDWLEDEDPPEDLNKDGFITMMRVRDKQGTWVIDEEDPRFMKKKEDDTPLDKLYKLYPEGIDNDGDGSYNEDGLGGFNINRNFPHNFGYNIKGLGVYPASEKETQSVIDFMTRYVPELKTQPRKNICGVLIFSKYDNLASDPGIECGTPTFPQPPQDIQAAGARPMFMFFGRRMGDEEEQRPPARDPQPKKTSSADEYLFKNVSEKYKEITGIKSAHSEKPVGSMLEWAYFQFGVPAFSANLWSLREEEKGPAAKRPGVPSAQPQAQAQQAAASDRRAMFMQMMARSGGRTPQAASKSADSDTYKKWLDWIDKNNNGEGFVEWTSFEHPQLGEVEIGGFVPYLRVNPPAEKLPDLAQSHSEFALFLASQFADIKMDEPQVKKLSSGLFELTVKLHNKGRFPYATAMGQRTRNINPIIIRLDFEDDDNMTLFGGTKRVDTANIEQGGEKEIRWLILSPSGKKVNIRLWARHGGGETEQSFVLR
jgi:hypothetical protein